jgi:hypothetical protein
VPHHISVKPKDLVESVRSQVEKIRLDFIASEINTARAFASTAETLYDNGSIAHGDTAADMAWKAYESAKTKLRDPSVGRELQNDFSRKLRQVRVVLDGLSFNEKRRMRVNS